MSLDSESFDLLLASVQRFIKDRLLPAENVLEETNDVPADIVEDMKSIGLFGLTVPEELAAPACLSVRKCWSTLSLAGRPRHSARSSAPISGLDRRES